MINNYEHIEDDANYKAALINLGKRQLREINGESTYQFGIDFETNQPRLRRRNTNLNPRTDTDLDQRTEEIRQHLIQFKEVNPVMYNYEMGSTFELIDGELVSISTTRRIEARLRRV
jgi:hypothetical protein